MPGLIGLGIQLADSWTTALTIFATICLVMYFSDNTFIKWTIFILALVVTIAAVGGMMYLKTPAGMMLKMSSGQMEYDQGYDPYGNASMAYDPYSGMQVQQGPTPGMQPSMPMQQPQMQYQQPSMPMQQPMSQSQMQYQQPGMQYQQPGYYPQ